MRKVLLVNDDPGVRSLLVRLIRALGHEIAEAVSGVKALEFLEESDTDLIVTDVNTPDLPGLSLLELVKKRVPHVPVVLVTSNASPEAMLCAVRMGAFDCLARPFGNEALQAVVERALACGR